MHAFLVVTVSLSFPKTFKSPCAKPERTWWVSLSSLNGIPTSSGL